MPFPKLRELKEDFKAWRRGEKRISPYGTRGRIYSKKGASPAGVSKVGVRPQAKLIMKITRADGTVEIREEKVTYG